MNEQSASAARGIVRHRVLRCVLTALLTAAILVGFVGVFALVSDASLVSLFILTLAVSFCSAQVHERLVRQGQSR